MRLLSSLCAAALLFGVASVGLASDYSGKWELQSLGGDRNFNIEHKGKKLLAHRVMWPEFEGEKYKLEHLYRGKIKGNKIIGQLLVKEDELPEFEVLRNFTGSISNDSKILLDGLPLKRIGKASGAAPEAPKTPNRPNEPPAFGKASPPPAPPPTERVSEPPTFAEATPPPAPPPASSAPPAPPPPAYADATPAPPPPPSPTAPPPPADSSMSLFDNIMGTPGMGGDLFQVAAQITIPDEAAELSEEGNALFKKRKWKKALAKYEAAQEIGGSTHVGLLHRVGRCHLKLKDYAAAKTVLRRALKLDPDNRAVRKDYKKAKKRA